MEKENFSVWDIKFLRSTPFMPFGSMIKAYGQINQGKGMTIEKFLKDANKMFEEAQLLTQKAFDDSLKTQSEGVKEVKFPTKNDNNR